MKRFKKIKFIGIVAVIMIAGAISALAAENEIVSEFSYGTEYYSSRDWQFLGSRDVHRGYDRDVIHLDRRVGRLRALQLRTGERRTDIHEVEVHFRNGDVQHVNLRRSRRNGEAHIIDLAGGARNVRKVVFWGSNENWKGRRGYNNRLSVIELWGIHVDRRRNRNYRNGYYQDRYDSDRYYDNYYDRRRRGSYCPSRR